jgi:Tol biopolymer transport system component
MPLTPGTRLGPYEVLAPVGAGGMGEVYRARDSRLEREVAIKVLAAAVAQDPDRLARFEREAKVVASLNHPNIAQVYSVEHSGDTRAIVMELVPGSTLAVPQPLETALDYARQIADALEAAHDKGITHRDLKPANVMVTREGLIKVLDFGLATAPGRDDRGPSAAAVSDAANSPTFTMAATQAGFILGTAAYMSPEQAAGKPVDRRSDIWSFGVVLWEMLTGARLFEGETVSHTIADVLRAPIDLGKLPAGTPATIVEILRRCLDRNVRTRLQSIGEARIAIEGYLKDPGAAAGAATVPVASRRTGWTGWAAAAAFGLLAAGLGFVAFRHSQEAPPKTLRMSILPPAKTSFVATSYPAISADGKKLAFAAMQDGKTTLWVRDLDSLSARNITGTDGASNPFWSPDGQAIGFYADGKMKKVELAGGAVLALCTTEGNFHGASWSSRGLILYATAPTGPLYRIGASGGTSTPVTALDEADGEISHRLPWFLPDGRHFLYTVRNQDQSGKSAVYVGDLDSKERVLVYQGEAHAAYAAAGGFLVYVTGGITDGPAIAQRFDPATLRVLGEPTPIAELVDRTIGVWASHAFSVAQDGTLVYASSGLSNAAQLTWFDRSGRKLGTVGEPDGAILSGAISPDGSTVATTRLSSGTRDIWLHDLARGVTSRFTFNPTYSFSTMPVWSADGKSVMFAQTERLRPKGILRKPVAGGGSPEPVGNGWGTPERMVSSFHASADRRYLAARLIAGGQTGSDIWSYRLDRPGERPRPYLQTAANEGTPNIAPDGDWIAYTSDETRRAEVYIQSFPEPGRKYQVSVNGGATPVWSRDGKELFFIGPDRKMMAVGVKKAGDRLDVGTPHALFDTKIVVDNNAGFDVSRDGRFLIPVQEQNAGMALTVAVDWQAALKK